jgi:hypothetical protein
MRRMSWVVAGLSAAMVLGIGTGEVFASHGRLPSPSALPAPKALITAGGPPCAMATMTSEGVTHFYPPAVKNVVAVILTKRCAGPVTALLTAETSAGSGSNDAIRAGIKITCNGSGGFQPSCRKGVVRWATGAGNPRLAGHAACLNCYANSVQSNAINASWPILPPGVYTIQVIGGANAFDDQIDARTLQAIGWSKA